MASSFKAAGHSTSLNRGAQAGFLTMGRGLLLASVVIAAVLALKFVPSGSSTAGPPAPAQAVDSKGQMREVDFGFVELDPARPVGIASYKNGGNMVLYAGDEFRYQVLGDAPLPQIELRIGDSVQILPGAEGAVELGGPANVPLQAKLVAQGSRHSLPGGAPPRVSVKVQVYGAARPK